MKVVSYPLVVACVGLTLACGHAPAPVPAPAPVAVPVPQVAPAPPASPQELAKRAIAQNDPTLLAQAADADPRVAPWLLLRQADALAKQGRFAEAAQAESQIIAAASETTAATTARLRLPTLEAHAGDAAATNAAFTAAMQVPVDETTEGS